MFELGLSIVHSFLPVSLSGRLAPSSKDEQMDGIVLRNVEDK